ncbi:hypothetical protein LCGC14_1851810 [marine sediment metagenome]|uniref:Uncharacterized protein n=1 Tax=marine sediment metagenome TaxID=412755 RepID=A0A0F9GA20_9ZZZZ
MAKNRKPINHKGMARKTPPIDYTKIPESGCPAKVGIWPLRKVCGHKFFYPLIYVKIVPDTKPVCFGMVQSPFVICEKCGANLRDLLDAESAAQFRAGVDKIKQSDNASNISQL